MYLKEIGFVKEVLGLEYFYFIFLYLQFENLGSERDRWFWGVFQDLDVEVFMCCFVRQRSVGIFKIVYFLKGVKRRVFRAFYSFSGILVFRVVLLCVIGVVTIFQFSRLGFIAFAFAVAVGVRDVRGRGRKGRGIRVQIWFNQK